LIFLEASDSTLVRRFSETRRPHPLAADRSVSEGIAEERRRLDSIRSMADLILDTSNMTVHELRDRFMVLSRDGRARAEMVVNLVSFGYKNGVPMDADLVFDVRCLPNPHFVERLRGLTGRDAAVARYMRRSPATREFIDRLTSFLNFALPQYVQEGKSYLTVAIGCTGGRVNIWGRGTMGVTRVEKPWGYELHWAKTERYVGKVLHVKAGHALSLQYHNLKDETIYLYSGRMLFEIERNGTLTKEEMQPGDVVHVTPKTVHRMTAIEDCDVLEVSTPELDDVVRLEDRYGRIDNGPEA
jgi:quercetin dioxygenase-like cupin family protein